VKLRLRAKTTKR